MKVALCIVTLLGLSVDAMPFGANISFTWQSRIIADAVKFAFLISESEASLVQDMVTLEGNDIILRPPG